MPVNRRIRIAMTAPLVGADFSGMISEMAAKGYMMDCVRTDGTDTIRAVKRYEAVIVGSQRYDRGIMERLLPELALIAKFGSGYDNIDVGAATQLGVAVTNAPGANSLAVAEHALSLMLCLSRRICRFDREIRDGFFKPAMTPGLAGKTVGIVGLGSIGRSLAALLKGFSCRIMANDKVIDPGLERSMGIQYRGMDDIARLADFVSVHLPLTSETEASIGMEFFRGMKRSAFFINTSRGRVVREVDLVTALRDGLIAGAGLDVFAAESIDERHPLCGLDNVVLTPHTAAHTDTSMADMMSCCLSNIMDYFEGRSPANLLNQEPGR